MLHEIKVPTLAIIGEGGSGGAIALASSSKVIMLKMQFIHNFSEDVLLFYGEIQKKCLMLQKL